MYSFLFFFVYFVLGLFCVINFPAVINQSLITFSEWPVYCIIFMFLLHTQGETLIKHLSIYLH